MKLMIDTNIFLDVLTKREPFYEESREVLRLCENKEVEGFISASSVTDLYYLIHKHTHDKELAYDAIGAVLDIIKVLTVSNDDVLEAYMKKSADFEDCLLATCAKNNNCAGIVTRDPKDFAFADINVYTPEEIIGMMK